MNRHAHVRTHPDINNSEGIQFYILGDTGRWLVGAGAHSDVSAIDTYIGGGNGAQAQLMVNQLVVMLI